MNKPSYIYSCIRTSLPYLLSWKSELLLKPLCILLHIFISSNCDRSNYFPRSLQLGSRLTEHAIAGKNSACLPSGPERTPPLFRNRAFHRRSGFPSNHLHSSTQGKSQLFGCLVRASCFFSNSDSKRYNAWRTLYKQLTTHAESLTSIYTQLEETSRITRSSSSSVLIPPPLSPGRAFLLYLC